MDLCEFVRASLVDIASGVQEADAAVSEIGGWVNPSHRDLPGSFRSVGRPHGIVTVQEVQFDVAVTASKAEGAEGKAGIEVVGISLGLGVKGTTQSEAVSVSRLRFSVPIVLPSTKNEGRRS
jgi:hypothetical protein